MTKQETYSWNARVLTEIKSEIYEEESEREKIIAPSRHGAIKFDNYLRNYREGSQPVYSVSNLS